MAIKDLRQKDEQEPHCPILPSHQTRQRPFQEKQTVMEFLVLTTFVFGRLQKVRNPFKSGRTVNDFVHFSHKGVAHRKWRFPSKRRGV